MSPDFADLVRGMTKHDAGERLTLEQIKAHAWMRGDTATDNELKENFLSLVPVKNMADTLDYSSMQKQRQSWN